MKINLAENMLRFGVKNLNETSTHNIKTLAEQSVRSRSNTMRPRSIYNEPDLSKPAGDFKNVFFKISKSSPNIYFSTSTTFIKNVFGSGKTLLSLDLYEAVGTDETDIKPAKSYGLVLRWTPDTQVKYAMDKSIDLGNNNKQKIIKDTDQINSTLDQNYFPMWTLNPNISGPMATENLALLITKAFKSDIRSTIKGYKQYIDNIMINLQSQSNLFTNEWDDNAIERLKIAIQNDPGLKELQTGLINSLNG